MRKMFAAFTVGSTAVAAGSGGFAQVPAATVKDATLQIMLSAGDWSEHADDDKHSKQVPFEAASSLGPVAMARSSKIGVGSSVSATAAAVCFGR